MKQYLFLLSLTLVLFSCQKKESFKPTDYPEIDGMQGMIDDRSFSAESTSGIIKEFRDTSLFTIVIDGRDYKNDDVILLQYVLPKLTPGSYKINSNYDGNLVNVAAYDNGNDTFYYSNMGALVIDRYMDSTLYGSFDFTTTKGNHIRGTFATKPDYRLE